MTDDTRNPQDGETPIPIDVAALDPWMLALVREADSDADHVAVPREMMWHRIQQQRTRAPSVTAPVSTLRVSRWRGLSAIAAVLLAGVAIGRYALPRTDRSAANTVAASADSLATPTRVAMSEHLVRTVALLTAVRDRDPAHGPVPDVSAWARDLLGTTRLLLDDPTLRDDHTRRLLQDLELVLMQIIESRGTSAPETQRAPAETMRETNLLSRVRAVVTATASRTDLPTHGADE